MRDLLANMQPYIKLAGLSLLASAIVTVDVAAQTGPPVTAQHTNVTVSVFDADTGAPLENAAVDFETHNQLLSADINGQATFGYNLPAGGTDVRFEVTARGRAPIFVSESVNVSNAHVSVALPRTGLASTPLISSASGGAYAITTNVGGKQVELEVDIPPGSLPFDASVDVTPYPSWSTKWKHSADPERFRMGYFYFQLRDATGAVQPAASLLNSIEVGIKPWFLEPSGSGSFSPDPAHFTPRVYDASTTSMVPSTSVASFSTTTGMISWDIDAQGVHGVGINFAPSVPSDLWVGNTNPAYINEVATLMWLFAGDLDTTGFSSSPASAGPITKVPLAPTVTLKGSSTFFCGIASANTNGGLSKGSNWGVSAGVVANIKSNFNVKTEGAAKLLAEAEVGTSVEFGVNAGGSVGGTTTEDISWGSTAGSIVSNQCCSGNYYVSLIVSNTQLKVGAVTLGTVSSPMAGATRTVGNLDSTCHYSVGDHLIDCDDLPGAPNCSGSTEP